MFNDAPKVENLKRLFASEYRDAPVTVLASNKVERIRALASSIRDSGKAGIRTPDRGGYGFAACLL